MDHDQPNPEGFFKMIEERLGKWPFIVMFGLGASAFLIWMANNILGDAVFPTLSILEAFIQGDFSMAPKVAVGATFLAFCIALTWYLFDARTRASSLTAPPTQESAKTTASAEKTSPETAAPTLDAEPAPEYKGPTESSGGSTVSVQGDVAGDVAGRDMDKSAERKVTVEGDNNGIISQGDNARNTINNPPLPVPHATVLKHTVKPNSDGSYFHVVQFAFETEIGVPALRVGTTNPTASHLAVGGFGVTMSNVDRRPKGGPVFRVIQNPTPGRYEFAYSSDSEDDEIIFEFK